MSDEGPVCIPAQLVSSCFRNPLALRYSLTAGKQRLNETLLNPSPLIFNGIGRRLCGAGLPIVCHSHLTCFRGTRTLCVVAHILYRWRL